MVAYLMISITVAILGAALVVAQTTALRRRRERRRAESAHRAGLCTQQELDEYLRLIDQATAEDLDRLDKEKGDD